MARLVVHLVACALAIAVPAAAARAPRRADRDPPVIEHVPPAPHDGSVPLRIEARIRDDSEIFEPTLLVRRAGEVEYLRLAMLPSRSDPEVYFADVPVALLRGELEYLIEAFDVEGNGPARVGEEAIPLRAVRAAAKPVAPTPTPAVTPEEDEDSNVGVILGVSAGAVVLVGAAAGVAYALFALQPPAPETVRVRVAGPVPVEGGAP